MILFLQLFKSSMEQQKSHGKCLLRMKNCSKDKNKKNLLLHMKGSQRPVRIAFS